MMDTIAMLIFLGFFAAIIYDTMTRPQKAPADVPPAPAPAPKRYPPGPVGLSCSICRTTVGMVSHEEYMGLVDSGRPVYCVMCTVTIEGYKRQQQRRS